MGKADIETFKAQKRKEGLAPKTINSALTVLRTLFTVAVEQEVLSHAPRVKLLKVEKPEFDFLTFEEAERLVSATDPEWRTMVVVGLHTGLRRGELIALQWDALDLVAGRLLVKRNVWRGHFGPPKGGRSREVPLNAVARRRGLPQERCLPERPPPGHQAGGAATRRLAHPAAYVRQSPGDAGVPLKAVQELLGHASVEMTMRYAHLSPDVKKDAVRALEGHTVRDGRNFPIKSNS